MLYIFLYNITTFNYIYKTLYMYKISVLVLGIALILDIVTMFILELKGGDTTALLGGTAVGLLIFIDVLNNPKNSLDEVAEHVVHGLSFAISIFGVIIQIAVVWVGGGYLVHWSVVAATAICGVSPIELAKRNFIPIMVGFVVTTIVAIFLI